MPDQVVGAPNTGGVGTDTPVQDVSVQGDGYFPNDMTITDAGSEEIFDFVSLSTGSGEGSDSVTLSQTARDTTETTEKCATGTHSKGADSPSPAGGTSGSKGADAPAPTPTPTLTEEEAHWLEIVSADGSRLADAPPEIQNNKAVVLAAVSQDGTALQYASSGPTGLQNDREVVLAAVSQNGLALGAAYETLKNDKAVVIAAVTQNGQALVVASPELQQDREVVLAAVSQDGNALRFVAYGPTGFQNDKGVVLAAVRQNPNAIHFASTALQNDPDVIAAAAGFSTEPAQVDISSITDPEAKQIAGWADSDGDGKVSEEQVRDFISHNIDMTPELVDDMLTRMGFSVRK
ncbi:MAG: DUF4116 domain-containing protein [Candidatus Margulisiibacteriota bacterium]